MSVDEELEKIKRDMMKRMLRAQQGEPAVLRQGAVNVLTDSSFDRALTETVLPVLVDFWAEWCAPCRAMALIVDQLASELSGRAFVAKLNVDQNQATAARFGVMSIPSFIVFRDGRPAGQVVGATGKQSLLQLVRRVSP